MSRLRLASWNVNSLKIRLPQVLDWLSSAEVDALVMQETKTVDELFPEEAFREAGFDVFYSGQKTYNGVALCARRETVAASDPKLRLAGWSDPQKRFVSALLRPKNAADSAPIRFCGGYFPNGQAVGSAKYLYKLDWIAVLERTLKAELAQTPRLVLGGDFNIAPADADIWDPDARRGQILCSEQERRSLERLYALGLADSFRLFEQPAALFSWWDYRQSGFERNHGLRIDLMLVSEALQGALERSFIDEGPRGNTQPSDHAPAVIDLNL